MLTSTTTKPSTQPTSFEEELEVKRRELEYLSTNFSRNQSILGQYIGLRSKLENQYQENLIVKQEFEDLYLDSEDEETIEEQEERIKNDEESYKIYKLIGPVLLPQSFDECNLNVDKRIEFIQNDIKRLDKQINDQQLKINDIKNQLMNISHEIANSAINR